MAVVISDEAFLVALGSGLAGAVIVVAGQHVGWRLGSASVASVAIVVGLLMTGRGSATLVGALALLAAGGWLTAERATSWQIGAAAPGAVLLTSAISSSVPPWIRIAAGATTLALAPAIGELDRRTPRLTGLLLAVSAGGVLGTTPDTEHARALAGGALGAVPVSAARRTAPDPAGAASFAGLLSWTAAVDGFARPGAVVGGLACAGVFALTPVVARTRPPTFVIGLVHVGLVGVASRIGGFEHGAQPALLIVITALVAGAAGLALAGGWARRHRGLGQRR